MWIWLNHSCQFWNSIDLLIAHGPTI
jgi:hypothetical protein